jgi:site-specific DNA-methyltransferase (adenine-specific)
VARFRAELEARLDRDGVVVLAPSEADATLELLDRAGVRGACAMLDPWYNKGIGGVVDDDAYTKEIVGFLRAAAAVADHVYLWGFPEIVARFVERLPEPLNLVAWLTWYYKNNPSVIRGWRSAQMTCLHASRAGAPLHPEHFLNAKQLAKKAEGKLRYLPGPTSVLEGHLDVIEEALLVGFVGKAEQTGHPAQKPQAVYDRLLLMVTLPDQLVIDPLCGSGTTGASARALGRRAVLADRSEDYVALVERRLGLERLPLP